jgi:thymidylate synthase
MPSYLPFSEREPSHEYRDMLREIRDRGVRVETKQGVEAIALAGYAMRFPMQQGRR